MYIIVKLTSKPTEEMSILAQSFGTFGCLKSEVIPLFLCFNILIFAVSSAKQQINQHQKLTFKTNLPTQVDSLFLLNIFEKFFHKFFELPVTWCWDFLRCLSFSLEFELIELLGLLGQLLHESDGEDGSTSSCKSTVFLLEYKMSLKI